MLKCVYDYDPINTALTIITCWLNLSTYVFNLFTKTIMFMGLYWALLDFTYKWQVFYLLSSFNMCFLNCHLDFSSISNYKLVRSEILEPSFALQNNNIISSFSDCIYLNNFFVKKTNRKIKIADIKEIFSN